MVSYIIIALNHFAFVTSIALYRENTVTHFTSYCFQKSIKTVRTHIYTLGKVSPSTPPTLSSCERTNWVLICTQALKRGRAQGGGAINSGTPRPLKGCSGPSSLTAGPANFLSSSPDRRTDDIETLGAAHVAQISHSQNMRWTVVLEVVTHDVLSLFIYKNQFVCLKSKKGKRNQWKRRFGL